MDPIQFRSKDIEAGAFSELTKAGPLTSKLKLIHDLMRKRYPFIDRVAVAIFHSESGKLKAFVSSNEQEDPLARYEFPLHQALSLMESIVKGPRVVNDLSVFAHGVHEHTQKIRDHGYKASYTAAITFESAFWGFIFLNSYQSNCFTPEVIENLDLFCHIINSVVFQDLNQIRTLNSALKTLAAFVYSKNASDILQTERMSLITRCILEELTVAKKISFSDETMERLVQFAGIHDVGKVAVPDSILFKKEKLSIQEHAIMTAHTENGLKMVDAIITNFGLEAMPAIDMLRNVVLSHHERVNGSGYPFRHAGNKVSMEARIVAVADVYNGLTSNRPHRVAHSAEEAFAILNRLAGPLDRDCVGAALRCKDKLQTL
jgi:hypothetical protein